MKCLYNEILAKACLFLSVAAACIANGDIGPSLSRLDDATFVIRNELSAFKLKVEDGAVRLISQERRDVPGIWQPRSAFFFKEENAVPFDRFEMSETQVAADRVTKAHLEVEIEFFSKALRKRLVFRMYPKSSMLACDGYYQGTGVDQDLNDASLFAAEFADRHWKYRAVEFFDQTDENNNLVSEREIIGYEVPQYLNGNVLLTKNLMDHSSFLILKEAPSSFSQLNHKGYDFELSKFGLGVKGIGFSPGELKADQWVKAYSVALSVSGESDLEQLSTLRAYQHETRIYDPKWDEMVMMNNWGDRNRDSNTGEDFVKREIDASKRLGISHYQIDDGWQQGLSKNSAFAVDEKWDQWDLGDWEPHRERFPNGFGVVVDYAKSQGVALGLWFAPSNANSFADWERDARIIIGLYKKYDVRYFKIDGIRLPDKLAEENLRKMLSLILEETDRNVYFNFDATAHTRGGFHFLYEYGGSIFLENRYTTFKKYYYPYQTLRNLWMLSKYVPAERMQIEFLNKWKNQENYTASDRFSPINVPFEYEFALTMAAQPLAWFEGSALPPEGQAVGKFIKAYRQVSQPFHEGTILPIGEEPNGTGWTGFQSVTSPDEGYLLIYRELNDQPSQSLKTYLDAGQRYTFTKVLGAGKIVSKSASSTQAIEANLPEAHSFLLVKYRRSGAGK